MRPRRGRASTRLGAPAEAPPDGLAMAELSKAIARLMEERERAQPAAAVSDLPKLRAVLDRIRAQVVPGERPVAEAFARQMLDRAADVLAEADVDVLAGIVTSAYEFVSERRTGEPHVRIFDPDTVNTGYTVPCTVVQTLMGDRPFIIDTVRECLRQAGCGIRRMLHPVLTLERDAQGALRAVAPPGAPGRKESFVHVEVDRVADPDTLAQRLTLGLTAVVQATDDYQAMRAKAAEVANELRRRTLARPWNENIDEIAAFFDWLGQKNFVFLGYREYQFSGQGTERTVSVRRGTGLGILRDESRSSAQTPRLLDEDVRRRLNEPPLLIVSNTNAESPIHRSAPMDYVGIKEIDAAGLVVGERRFLGLFTAKAYAEDPSEVPLLRGKLRAVLEMAGALEDSHDHRAIVTVFGSLPRVELLVTGVSELHDEIHAILAAEGSSDITVLARPDGFGRGIFVAVILPRARFSDELYRGAGACLMRVLSATAVLAERLVIDESDQVRMHFYFAAPAPALVLAPPAALRTAVAGLLRTWDDRLREALQAELPGDAARGLLERYATAFSAQYKAATEVGLAVRDIRHLEALRATRTPQVDVTDDAGRGAPRVTAVKLYLADEELVLSDFLPVLENLGLKVLSADALEIALRDLGRVRIHTFFVQDAVGAPLEVAAVAPLLKPAVLLLHAGRIDNDRLNALILHARLEWRQVDLLRAYVNHGVQIGSAPSREALVHALVGYPRTARALWEYFAAKFDPQLPAAPRDRLTSSLAPLEEHFVTSLDAVQSVVDDRILRALFHSIAATTRTNYFRQARAGDRSDLGAEPAVLAIKLASGRIPHLRSPQPLCEIYVHAPQVEGVHLRAARVARGGIRLSERPHDFRTEVFDLMKTQMVKNAVIVPAGAKGGFIVRGRAGAPPANHVVAAYRTFIGALLELTDNIVQGRLTPSPGLAYDEPDPYLVVAADKGTATFSDVANEVAAQHRFWLGDAFASGGTHGYDHKKEGITARGAWECVRRHFRELGRDADRDTLTVIGIGDMSGDVFGNGLLLSRRLCLRAAFNHHHIFLDPNPDPARSFAERERLFHLPRSGWSDYNPSLISAGGGVFRRTAKTILLSPAARQMLGLEVEAPSGEETIRAILRMPADLLWNGGIGTYVKASDETHAAADDSSNDAVRVDAAALRVKVVAEGGNLGFTQRGRIEYALRGGRINTDAIDNSGGVDMSDHEVNLKMALSGALENGQLPLRERNRLLAELTPEVTRRVLAHNQRQARVLSLDHLRSETRLAEFRAVMSELEAAGALDRRLDSLPDRETLRNRRGIFLGLTRPELAVLLAHGKLVLQHQLLASNLPDDPFFEPYLREYFPEIINARFGHGVRSHRLRREIIAMEVANVLLDVTGAAFVSRVARETGAETAAVVRAWAVAVAVGGVRAVWEELATLDPPLPVQAEVACWLALEAALERATKWIVETQPAEVSASELAGTFSGPVQEFMRLLRDTAPETAEAGPSPAVEALAAHGTPRALAQRLAALDRLAEAFEIAQIAREFDVPRSVAAQAYYRASEVVDLDWLRVNIGTLPGEDRWERRAVEGLSEGLVYARRQLTHGVLSSLQAGADVGDCLRAYLAANQPQIDKVRALIDDLKSARHPTLASVVVVMRELGRLVGRRA
jgi:glutamate dehydrogenase